MYRQTVDDLISTKHLVYEFWNREILLVCTVPWLNIMNCFGQKVPPLQNDSEKGDRFVVWDMSEGDTDGSIPSGIRFDSQLSDYGIGFD